MRRWIITVLFFLISLEIHAELKCQLRYIQSYKMEIGIPTHAQMVFWPKDEFNLSSFMKQNKNGSSLLGMFYLNKVESLKKSDNNEDAVVVDLELVLIKMFDPGMIHMYSDEFNSCAVDFQNLKIQQPESKQLKVEIKVLDQKSPELEEIHLWYWKLLWLLILPLLYILYMGIVFLRENSRKKQKTALRKDYYSHLFTSASARADFEKIYIMRHEWLVLIDVDKAQHSIDHFFSMINKIQFKEVWSDDELKECVEAFHEVRRCWNG